MYFFRVIKVLIIKFMESKKEKNIIKRDWADLCEKAYFQGYIEEMIELINDNQEEFYEFVVKTFNHYIMKKPDGTWSLFRYFKNCMDYGVKYFISEFLEDDPWYNLEVNEYYHLGAEDEDLFTFDEYDLMCNCLNYK